MRAPRAGLGALLAIFMLSALSAALLACANYHQVPGDAGAGHDGGEKGGRGGNFASGGAGGGARDAGEDRPTDAVADQTSSDSGGGTGGTGGGGGSGAGGSGTGGSVDAGKDAPVDLVSPADAGRDGPGSGGMTSTGGQMATGGAATGGAATGGMATGGAATGGAATGGMATGGVATGGMATGGAATGGAPGTGGAPVKLPCDIYAADGGPCVAAHSTARALLAAFNGALYQVRRADGMTKDIPVLGPGGLADASVQDTFCGASACTISIIYDQSGMGNHLTKGGANSSQTAFDDEADAKALPTMLKLHKVYGEYSKMGVGYRNNAAVGTAQGDDAETIYMVVAGSAYNSACCFEYGNTETNSKANGAGHAEAVYFGNTTAWGTGSAAGPWVMGDLEFALFAGSTNGKNVDNTPVNSTFVTAMLKGGPAGANRWAIKAGNAQSGTLKTMFEGVRPNGWNPMHKEGAIGLGVAGNAGRGNFFEGLMTAHYASNAADDAVQANIVSAYGP